MTGRVEIEVRGVRALLEQSGLSAKRIARVMRMAANRTMRSLSSEFRKDIAKENKLKQPSLKYRIKYRPAKARGRNSYSRVWVGLNPMKASGYAFGRIREAEEGAYANTHFFPGGFVARYGGKVAIYSRFGLNDEDIKIEDVEIDTPGTRRRMTKSTEEAGERYVDELVVLVGREWDKIAKQTKRKSA